MARHARAVGARAARHVIEARREGLLDAVARMTLRSGLCGVQLGDVSLLQFHNRLKTPKLPCDWSEGLWALSIMDYPTCS